MYKQAKFLSAGDRALVMELGAEISPAINRQVRNFSLGIEKNKIRGVEELVPTYRSILINYNPLLINQEQLIKELKQLESNIEQLKLPEPLLIEIPSCYEGEYAQDLEQVAQYNNISPAEVIELHSARNYLIYMLGFTPGFVYLGGMSEKIVTPRLKEPRTKIAAGSVGIADRQTGIYPLESPGGWRLIGRTPLELFSAEREPPILEGLEAGNYIKFKAISEEDYIQLKEEVEAGRYQVRLEKLDASGEED